MFRFQNLMIVYNNSSTSEQPWVIEIVRFGDISLVMGLSQKSIVDDCRVVIVPKANVCGRCELPIELVLSKQLTIESLMRKLL